MTLTTAPLPNEVRQRVHDELSVNIIRTGLFPKTREGGMAVLWMMSCFFAGFDQDTVESYAKKLKSNRKALTRYSARYNCPPPSKLMSLAALVGILLWWEQYDLPWQKFCWQVADADPFNLSRKTKEFFGQRPGDLRGKPVSTLFTLFFLRHWPRVPEKTPSR